MNYLLVFIGGGVGSVIRYGISMLLKNSVYKLPIATLITNLISCILIGLLVFYFSSKWPTTSYYRPLLIIGFCGGFSTFSTFSYETFELIRSGNYLFSILNVLISIGFGIGVLALLQKSI